MASENIYKIRTKNRNLFLRVSEGHFATSHSHINYYIDVSAQKARLSEASAVAKDLVSYYNKSTIVDTILCLDGTEVIGTCLAHELTKGDFMNMNAHQTIYVVTPEHTTGSQLIFRDNSAPMVVGKHVLVLAASVATGYTAQSAVEAIRYYNGIPVGICSIFACVEECEGFPVQSIYSKDELDGYISLPARECPLCKEGKKLDALVNSYGISSF